MGVVDSKSLGVGESPSAQALRKCVVSFAKKYFLTLVRDYPRLADETVLGTLRFDEKEGRLVKTYRDRMDGAKVEDYLYLDPPIDSLLE